MRQSTFTITVLSMLALPTLATADWATFTDQTGSRLVASSGLGANDPEEKDFAYADLDMDGDIDLIVVRKQPFTNGVGKRNVLLMNEGGVLVDRSVELATLSSDGTQGFLDITNDRDVAIADFNSDGWPDFVTCPALNQGMPKTISHPRIYINRGNDGGGVWLGFRYEESRIPTLPAAPNGCGIAAGDVTGDGKPDIYIVDYQSSQEDRLLINNGSGVFTDQTSSRMTAAMIASDFGTTGFIADMNGDGANDVVKTENGPFKASYNNPSNVGFFNGFESPSGGAHYGMSIGDLNNDGKIDVVLGDDGSDRFLLNTGNGGDGMANFENKVFSFQSGGDDGFGNNSRVVDINNDGFNDVLIADVDVDIGGCGRRLHLYRNLGNIPSVTLQDQGTCGIPVNDLSGTHDVAVFDLDGDGWKDLILGRCAGIRVWMNQPPFGASITYPQGLPGYVPPLEVHPFQVKITAIGGSTVNPGSATLHYILPGDNEQTAPLSALGGDMYQANLPGVGCTERIDWWVTATLAPGAIPVSDPPGAPAAKYTALAAEGTQITLRDEFEGNTSGWVITNDASLTGGTWVSADPNGTIVGGQLCSPENDATSGTGVKCFVTQNGTAGGAAGASDVDGGPTTLISKPINLAGIDAMLSFAAWFFCDDVGATGADFLTVDLSNDNGANWVPALSIATTNSSWQAQFVRVSDFVTPTASVLIRFRTSDVGNNSATEAGIDNFQIEEVICEGACTGDLNRDGIVDGADLGSLLGQWGAANGSTTADFNDDNIVDGADLGVLLGAWGECK